MKLASERIELSRCETSLPPLADNQPRVLPKRSSPPKYSHELCPSGMKAGSKRPTPTIRGSEWQMKSNVSPLREYRVAAIGLMSSTFDLCKQRAIVLIELWLPPRQVR